MSGYSFHAFALQWLETRISPSLLVTRGPKLGQNLSKSNHSRRWSGYISMLHFRLFVRCSPLRMSGNPIFITFAGPRRAEIEPIPISGGRHDTLACHISGHFLKDFSLECPPEDRIWASTDQNQIISGDGEDTAACHILGHSFIAFSLECPGIPISLKIVGHRRAKTGPILAKAESFMEVGRIHATFHAIIEYDLLRMPRKPDCYLATRRPKLGQCPLISNHFWMWSGYISVPHFAPFLPCILLRMLGCFTGQTNRRTDVRTLTNAMSPADLIGEDNYRWRAWW